MKPCGEFFMCVDINILTQIVFDAAVKVAQDLCPIIGDVCIYTLQDEKLVEVYMDWGQSSKGVWDTVPCTWYNKNLCDKHGLKYSRITK